MPIQFYDSIGAFRDELDKIPQDGNHRSERNGEWYGNQTFKEACHNLLKGRLSAVPKADALLEKISGDAIETERPGWIHSVSGFLPCVPSYLADSPESMRSMILEPSASAPVRIFASVCVSAGISADELQSRGIAILALCRKLQKIRPVELFVFAELKGTDTNDGNGKCAIPVIKIETSPLDLSTATYALTDAAFLRQLCLAWGDQRGFDGDWAWGMDPRSSKAAEHRRKAFKAEPQDLIIPGGFSEDPVVRQPVEWVNEQIARFVESED